MVSIASHRFFRPNLRPSLNSGDQTESIGTNFVQPALNLGLGQFLGLLFNKMIFFWPNSHWNLFTSGLNYSLIHFQPFLIPRKILKKTCQLWLSRTVDAIHPPRRFVSSASATPYDKGKQPMSQTQQLLTIGTTITGSGSYQVQQPPA
jgi:hypothetical protein